MASYQTPQEKSFMLQTETTDSARQPLEVHHLAHDLRGPLNSILGFAELLGEGIEGPLNEIQTEDIKAIYQSAQTLLNLINTVVDLSKLEASGLILNEGSVNIKQCLEKIISTKLTGNKLAFNLDLPNTLPLVWGDTDRVEQLLLNILKFTLKIQNVKSVDVFAQYNEQTITLKIVPLGGIILAKDVAGLFDLGVEVDATGRSKLGKGGLGLPLAQKLAHIQQGEVWATPETDEPLAFYVKLPRQVNDDK